MWGSSSRILGLSKPAASVPPGWVPTAPLASTGGGWHRRQEVWMAQCSPALRHGAMMLADTVHGDRTTQGSQNLAAGQEAQQEEPTESRW